MSFKFFRRLGAFVFATLMLACGGAHADLVHYQLTSLGGSNWRYDYTITAGNPSAGFDEVTIYFDPTLYSLLSGGTAPAGWDALTIQPDTGIPDDGYFDVLRTAGVLADGASYAGFSISFNYLGGGTPGAQAFDLYDSSDFSLRGSGITAQDLPEPNSGLLLALGLGCLAVPGLKRLRGMRPHHGDCPASA